MRKGFTLIELVIATVVLIAVFSIIGMLVSRIGKMRKDAEEQTQVYSQAMSILDSIEEDLRNISSTNLTFGNNSSKFYRTVMPPRGTNAGEAYTNMSFRTVIYEDGADYEYDSVARRSIGTWVPAETTTLTNYSSRTVYTLDDDGKVSVTNAVGGSGDVYIAGASKGDTISIPVVSGTAKRINGIRTAYKGWAKVPEVNIEPNEARTVFTGVTFTNTFNSSVVKIVKRPITGAWPASGTNSYSITQLSELVSECSTPLSFFSPPLLLDESSSGYVSTNLFVEVISNAVYIVENNGQPEEISYPVTNNVLIASVNITVTNEPPANAAAAFVSYQTSTNPIPGYWEYGTKPPANLPSGAEVTNPGLSNILNVVTNASGGIYDYREYDAFRRNAEWLSNLEFLKTQALPSSSNDSVNEILFAKLKDFSEGRSFSNYFYPYADGVKIPLGLHVGESVSPRLLRTANGFIPDYGTSLRITAMGTDTNTLLTSVSAKFKTCVSVVCEVTEENLILTSGIEYQSETTYTLETQIPQDIALKPGIYAYSGVTTNKNTTAYSEDTDWKDITLDEDFEGGTETITGLWLEEDNIDNTKLRAMEEFLYCPGASAPLENLSKFEYLAGDESYCSILITFYSFDGDADNIPDSHYEYRLKLIPINGDGVNDYSEENIGELRNKIPDCADVFIWLQPPKHNAMSAQKKDYYFYRRVPLKTRNLWSPP